MSLGAVSRGQAQNEAEQFVADSIPAREVVLVANASLQRVAIAIANMPFGFEAYPTFYDSSYLHCAGGRLVEVPYKLPDPTLLKSALNSYAQVINQNKDIRFVIALVDRSGTFVDNPARGYVSRPADYEYYFGRIEEQLADLAAIVNLSTIRSYNQGAYFKTDHHWQVDAAYDAYCAIVEILGKEPVRVSGFKLVYEGSFYGALARSGLDPSYSDVVLDADYAHGDFELKVNGKDMPESFLDASWADDFDGYEKQDLFANVYADYYHGDPGLIEITNNDIDTGTMVIVGDSFTNNMERFFAEVYHEVDVIDLRHFEGTLCEYLESKHVDDCVFLMSANNLTSQTVVNHLR